MREIPNNCLEEKTTTCLVYTGQDIPSLDIKNGDAIEYVIQQLASKAPSQEVPELTVKAFNLPVLSSCAAKVINTAFSYEIATRVNTLYFSWNIDNALPSGYGYTTTLVEAVSSGVISQSDSRSGMINIPISNLPVNIRIEQRVSSECGEIILHQVIPVTGSFKGTYNSIFQVRDLSNTPSELPLDQAFDALFAMTVQNQQQINDFRAVNTQMEIAKLESRIVDLETSEPEEEEEITYLDQNISQSDTVGDALTAAFNLIRANEAQINLLEAEIESLRTLISQS